MLPNPEDYLLSVWYGIPKVCLVLPLIHYASALCWIQGRHIVTKRGNYPNVLFCAIVSALSPNYRNNGHIWFLLRRREIFGSVGGTHRICKRCKAEADYTSMGKLPPLIQLSLQSDDYSIWDHKDWIKPTVKLVISISLAIILLIINNT